LMVKRVLLRLLLHLLRECLLLLLLLLLLFAQEVRGPRRRHCLLQKLLELELLREARLLRPATPPRGDGAEHLEEGRGVDPTKLLLEALLLRQLLLLKLLLKVLLLLLLLMRRRSLLQLLLEVL